MARTVDRRYLDCPTTGTHEISRFGRLDAPCPGCGRALYAWDAQARAPGARLGRMVRVAGDKHRRRDVEVATGESAKRGACTAACLAGKRSCDCRCSGRCHGAGRCSCGTARSNPHRQDAIGVAVLIAAGAAALALSRRAAS